MKRRALVVIFGLFTIFLLGGLVKYGVSISRENREATDYYILAKALYKEKKLKEAAELFRMIVREYSYTEKRDGALWWLAKCLKRLGAHKEAKKVWERVIDEYPKGKFASLSYYELGELIKHKDSQKANEFYHKAQTPMAFFRLGEYYFRKGLLEKAKDYCIEALNKEKEERKKDRIKTLLSRINVKMLTSISFTPKSRIYIVKEGDTLYGIAKRFNMPLELLKECNDLKGDLIKPHQRLKVVEMDYKIIIDKEKNILLVMADDEFFSQYRVATGIRTPTGKFKIASKLRNPVWYAHNRVVKPKDPTNIIGKIWIGFDIPGYGIHPTKDPNEIGKTITKGCIRMLEEDIEELFKIVPLGTEVEIVEESSHGEGRNSQKM